MHKENLHGNLHIKSLSVTYDAFPKGKMMALKKGHIFKNRK